MTANKIQTYLLFKMREYADIICSPALACKKVLSLFFCFSLCYFDYSTDRSNAVVPVLVLFLLLCGLFYEAICFMFSIVLFCSCDFQSF